MINSDLQYFLPIYAKSQIQNFYKYHDSRKINSLFQSVKSCYISVKDCKEEKQNGKKSVKILL